MTITLFTEPCNSSNFLFIQNLEVIQWGWSCASVSNWSDVLHPDLAECLQERTLDLCERLLNDRMCDDWTQVTACNLIQTTCMYTMHKLQGVNLEMTDMVKEK